MKFVVDAPVLIAVIVNEPEKARLVEITQGADLLAPASIPWEIGNAFSAMIKRNRITLEQAIEAIRIYNRIPVRYVEVELEGALKIAAKHKMYAYDAYLLRCAMKYKTKLLTLDKRLRDIAREMKIEIVEVD
jgi:predicted nucleic acid-binding protein